MLKRFHPLLLGLFCLPAILVGCSHQPSQSSSSQPGVLSGQNNVSEEQPSSDQPPKQISLADLAQSMLDSSMTHWKASEQAYIFYEGNMLTAKLKNGNKLILEPDPMGAEQKACEFDTTKVLKLKSKDLCHALLLELYQQLQ